MHRTDKYSKHSSIICLAWLTGWVFVCQLSGCGSESRCSHLYSITSILYSVSADDNLIPFLLWCRGTMLKGEKPNTFCDVLEITVFRLVSES